MHVAEEEFDEILGLNAEMSKLVIRSGLVKSDALSKCHKLIDKTRLKGQRPPELLTLIEEKGLINAQQKRALEKAARRYLREKETSQFKIKGYNLIRKIGSGGLGVVYQARQLSMKRLVAIKILHENWSKDEEFRSRFLLEARVMGRLSHQNLIQVYDVGRQDKHFYFSMEYIDGPTVESLIKKNGGMPVFDTLDIALQMARAINYISGYDIVHRDIKPANMMLTKTGTVKLGDFGFLYTKHQKELTSDGFVIGTPDYISPEQASGQDVDFRSDLYSLGVCMYHMLTGDVPYSGTVSGVMRQHVNGDLPERVLEQGDAIPSEIYNVICKLMAKNPSDRYQKVPELLEELQYLKAQEVVRQRGPQHVKSLSSHSEEYTVDESMVYELEKQNHWLFYLLIGALVIIAIETLFLLFH